MPIIHRFKCANGHTTEAVVRRGVDSIVCRSCGQNAPKFWGGTWRGRSNGEGHIHDVHGLGKVTTEELNAHVAKLKAKTGNDFVVEPVTRAQVNARIDDIDHECWLLDQEEGESKERQADREAQMAEFVKPRVDQVQKAGGSGRDVYDAAKEARAEFNIENPV